MAVWGGLTNSVKRREAKSKGEKERYKHLNAEFQKIARRDKKAFLSDQCTEIEEKNRMGKTRDLFKKIRDTKGTCHANMGSIKDRNGMDLTEGIITIYILICILMCMYIYCCCYSVTKSCPTHCDLMDYSTPGSSVLYYLLGFSRNHIRWVSDTVSI